MRRVYLAGPPFADEYRRRAVRLAHDAGWEPVDPMRRDFRGATEGHETEIVDGDLADIDSCDAVLAAFTAPDEGTAMEAWYAHSKGVRVIVYTGGTPSHPWTRYVAASVHASLEDAIGALG
ncbi:MAG TPA: nucleoside 2-deoxyribosyltransferase [Gaiellaceae bacterium]|nr:nucleoside 2-deoxyribosyltransferase [Gaiellaceae bacterium]